MDGSHPIALTMPSGLSAELSVRVDRHINSLVPDKDRLTAGHVGARLQKCLVYLGTTLS